MVVVVAVVGRNYYRLNKLMCLSCLSSLTYSFVVVVVGVKTGFL